LPRAPSPRIPFDRKIASSLSIRQAKSHALTFPNPGGELISLLGARLGPMPTIATAKTAGCMASEIGADLSDRASEAAGWMSGTESRQGLLNEGHSFGSLFRRTSDATFNLTQQLPCPAASAFPSPALRSTLSVCSRVHLRLLGRGITGGAVVNKTCPYTTGCSVFPRGRPF
jgi:hypothetical protein